MVESNRRLMWLCLLSLFVLLTTMVEPVLARPAFAVDSPQVLGLSPTSGPLAGGTSVVISGSGFTGASAVQFGVDPAASFSVDSDGQITAINPSEASPGTVDVTVTTPGGTSTASAADQFTYVPTPQVASVSPAAGPLAGGTSVVISGSGFTGASAVQFGVDPAASFSVDSDGQITAITPSEASPGTVDVIVTTPAGTTTASAADQFTYAPIPQVTGLAPSSGPDAGRTSVVISGSGFTGATAVEFSSLPAASFSIDSDGQITATSPAGPDGTVNVTVLTPGGTSPISSTDGFTFLPPPQVTAVSPATGPVSGGTTVTISGSGFAGATGVNFGSQPATGLSVVSDVKITAVSPASPAGPVDVSVTTAGGTSGASAADVFTYTPLAPAVSFWTLGSAGSTITVSGKGFAANAHLELFFDTANQGSAVSDGSGAFSEGLQVPLLAIPGSHWVTAVDRATGLSAQGQFHVSAGWTQFHGAPSLTGLNDKENVLSTQNAPTLVQLWHGTTGAAVSSSPAVSGFGWAYVGANNGNLYAFPPGCYLSCTARWTMPTGGPVTSSPALGSGVAGYVGSGDGNLYAFNTSGCGTAKVCPPIWKGATGGSVTSSPTVSGLVYVGSGDGNLYAFRQSACGTPQCSPVWTAPTGGPITGSPAVAFSRVFVGSGDGKVYAFSPATGALLWSRDVGAPVTSSPAVAQQNGSQPMVYVGTMGGLLYTLNAYTGNVVFTGQAGGPIESSPAVAMSDIYVGSDDGRLNAFNTVPCATSPCAPVWSATTDGPVTSSPAVANGAVYVGANKGGVYAFNGRSGKQLWNWRFTVPVRSSPAVANGQLFVGNDSGNLFAFRLSSPPKAVPKPNPATLVPLATPIRHVVIVYQENQSFDGVLGALCIQDSRCDGASNGTLPDGTSIPLAQAPDIVPAVAHYVTDQSTAVDGGKMDGFALIKGCEQSTGYGCYLQYQPSQIPDLAALARKFSISDRTFESDAVPSWGSHLTIAAAQMDGFQGNIPFQVPGVRLGPLTWGCDSNQNALWRNPDGSGSMISVPSCIPNKDGSGPYAPSPVSWVPTIMDRLDGAGMSWRIYSGWGTWSVCPSFSDCIYGPQRNEAVQSAQVIADAKNGLLPNLSVVIPGGPNSQHNGWSMLTGDNWIGNIVRAIENGPEWSSTAIFITYDDCGCFYDHVPPPPGLGIRVPMVLVSPYARARFTDSNVASYSSMLAFTEHAYGLSSLYTTDANAYDFSGSFDYTQTPLTGVPLGSHPIPAREQAWLRLHPPKDDIT